MSSLLHPLIADVSDLPWVAIIAVGGSMLLTIVIIIGGLIIAFHRQKQWHETARLALEKGQPLPAAHNEERQAQSPADPVGRDLRAGLIMIATGAGLYLFFGTFLPFLRFIAAIPGFIGVALLLYAGLSLLFKRKDTPPVDRP